MILLLDEDSQGKQLVQLLRQQGHDIVTVSEAGLTGHSDAAVLDYARRTNRALLTRNARDFHELHEANPDHPGILVEHQDADPAKNMTNAQIAQAIGSIAASGWDIGGEFIPINPWQ
jgi:predicted nuclease of predicted toxin-antitoxin system